MSIGEDRERELYETGFDTEEVFRADRMKEMVISQGQVIFVSKTTGTTYVFRVKARAGDVFYVILVKLEDRALTGAQQRKMTIRGGRGGKARVSPNWA